MRRPIRLFFEALLAVGALAALPSCGGLGVKELFTNPCGKNSCSTPPPQDCAALSKTSWSVGDPGHELDVAVGRSLLQFLVPNVEDQCVNSLASVTWTVDDQSVASVLAWGGAYQKTSAWVTGVAPGLTAVRAHIVFSDGGAQDAHSESVKVILSQASPPGGVLVAEGDVAVDAPLSHPGASYTFVPFKLQASGQVDITIDWVSPVNTLDFSVYKSPCTSIEVCGGQVMVTAVFDVKPVPASGGLSAGDYTIRIDNSGPGPETVHYEVRLTPK
jgi:hypothetical protein